MLASTSCMAVVSVISSIRRDGSSAWRASVVRTVSIKPACANCNADRLTAMLHIGWPSRLQRAICAHAASSTQVPMGTIKPTFSASGMN